MRPISYLDLTDLLDFLRWVENRHKVLLIGVADNDTTARTPCTGAVLGEQEVRARVQEFNAERYSKP